MTSYVKEFTPFYSHCHFAEVRKNTYVPMVSLISFIILCEDWFNIGMFQISWVFRTRQSVVKAM